MRVVVWMNMPTHHQSAFFEALRCAGVDLMVRYYGRVSASRQELGWEANPELPAGEQYLREELPPLRQVPRWQEAIHVIPGCGSPIVRHLSAKLTRAGAHWVHWSENSNPGVRRVLSFPAKRWHGALVNRGALGAFGVSAQALREFRIWGIHEDKMAFLPYSISPADGPAEPDEACEQFRRGRPAFLFLGTLRRLKAVDVLINAFSMVASRDAEWVLLLVGNDGAGNAYRRLAQRLALEDRVLFRGPVETKRTPGILRCANVVVLPSRYDGWGAVASEAASVGRALILSDRVGAAYHLLETGGNGFRVRAGSVASLFRAMHAYVQDESLACKHGDKSLEQFQGFTPARNAERFLGAINGWLARRRGMPHRSRAA